MMRCFGVPDILSVNPILCFVLFVSFYNGSQTKDALVLHTAHRFHKGCVSSSRNFPEAVCLLPNIPSGLTETLEIKSS